MDEWWNGNLLQVNLLFPKNSHPRGILITLEVTYVHHLFHQP